MLVKEIKYTDYNGTERTEKFYFNLTKSEIAEMQLSAVGGMDKKIQNIVDSQDIPGLIKLFKEFIIKSYGVKSEDGKRFIKNDAVTEEFMQSAAYDELFMSLLSEPDGAVAFLKGIIPNELAEAAEAQLNK